jgi:hypothetical protein
VIYGATGGYVICGAGRGMLLVELMESVDHRLWRNGRIDNMPDVGLGYFGKLVVERANDRMENIADSEEPIAWCG